MGTFEIEYGSYAKEKDIPDLSNEVGKRVRDAIAKKLTTKPELYGKPLHSPLSGYWSLRVGDYSVIYEFTDKRVIIFSVLHRSVAYEKVKRRLGL